jgi:hypothetical protein
MIDSRTCTICDCCCAMPNLEYFTRQQIRARFSMDYQVAMDCLCFLCFPTCLVCQDAREIKLRDPASASK